jgi:regulator of sigma E protease
MYNIVTNILAVVIVLGFMIFIHEWGHFMAAKLCGVRVDVFSLGFGTRLLGFKRGDTDYRLSALPFGGYVKMAGDTPGEEVSGAPDEFFLRPRWQRFLIAIAGPAMNIGFALVITIALLMMGGPEPAYMSEPGRIAGVLPDTPAAQAGLQRGDVITRINGRSVATWEDILFETAILAPGTRATVTILRDEETLTLDLPPVPKTAGSEADLIGYPHDQVIVGSVGSGSPAAHAGLQTNDHIVSAAGQELESSAQLASIVRSSNGAMLPLEVQRGSSTVPINVTPSFADPGDGTKRWQIGITFGSQEVYRSHSFRDALVGGIEFNVRMTRQILHVLAGLFEGRVSIKQLGGPVGIAPQLGQAARRSFLDLLGLTASISLNLGILNLLPIPILDGGHVLVLAIEGLLGRDLSVTIKERFVKVGLVFLLGVIVLTTYFDILKLLPNH